MAARCVSLKFPDFKAPSMTSIQPTQTPLRFSPKDTNELAQTISESNTVGRRLEIVGGGTKRSLGDPVTADAVLGMSSFTGIDFYEPEELVIKVRAGTSVAEIREALGEKKQHLAFEPPDYATFFGDPRATDTIGRIAACTHVAADGTQ